MYEYNNQESVNNDRIKQMEEAQAKAQAKENKKSGRKKFWGKVGTGLCVGVVFGLFAGCAFEGVTRTMDYFFPRQTTVTTKEVIKEVEVEKEKESPAQLIKSEANNNSNFQAKSASIGMDVSDIVDNNMPSIVSITNKSVQEVISMFGMGVQEYESTSAGSGIIIGKDDEELLIATNNHVISSAKTLTVGFVDDEVYTAYVKGADADIDLAVVAVKLNDIKKSTLDAISVAVIGDSDQLHVGEQVVAIGNALGYGQSVTTGIISALNRDVTNDRIDNPLIQTDAAINPGNSGGALFNMRGELIGINSAKIASTAIEGVGYAIPMSSATPIIESLMNRKTREEVDAKEAGYLGISGVSVDDSTSKMYGIPTGIYIQNVEEDSPADKAGLIKSDVVRKFDGVTVSSISDIRDNLRFYKAGETVDLLIYRLVDGEYVEKTISITLGSREGTALDPDNQTESEDKTDENSQEEENPNSEQDRAREELEKFFGNDKNFTFRFGY